MSERPTLFPQKRFGGRTTQAGLQVGDPRDVVDLQQPIQPAQIDTHDTGCARPIRRQAADHRRAAGEGPHREIVTGAQLQDRDDLVVVAGIDDDIGRVGGVAARSRNRSGVE